jgi:hypothetical protein
MARMVVFESTRSDTGGTPQQVWVNQDHVVMVRRTSEGSEITLSNGATVKVRNEPQVVVDAVASSTSSAARRPDA